MEQKINDTVPRSEEVILSSSLKKRNPRSREWVFTSYEEKFDKEFDKDKVRYVIYQQEICPKTEKKHFQGYAEFANPITYLSVHKYLNTNNKLHVEQRKGTREQARDYCRKTLSAVNGSQVEWGTFRENTQGARTDLDEIGSLIKSGASLREVAEQHTSGFIRFGRGIDKLQKILMKSRKWKTEVIIIWGPTGTGKSHMARELLPNAYWKSLRDWWDGYEGQEDVIIDEFTIHDTNRKELLSICDKYPYRVNLKGGSCEFLAKKLIITTNEDPKVWFEIYPELERRIEKVIHLENAYVAPPAK